MQAIRCVAGGDTAILVSTFTIERLLIIPNEGVSSDTEGCTIYGSRKFTLMPRLKVSWLQDQALACGFHLKARYSVLV